MDKNKKIEELRKKILSNDEKYYRGESEVPDELHDFTVRKLKMLGGKETGIGYAHSEKKEFKVKHKYPMLSLNNAFNEAELFALFFDSHKKLLEEKDNNTLIEYFAEPKIDGVSIDLQYKNGQLMEAVSRGDGYFGESWKDRIFQIIEIPQKINYTNEVYVRGEIFITKNNFQKIQFGVKNGEKTFINSRSYVSGALRLKNTEQIKNKLLSFIAYQAIFEQNDTFKTQEAIISFLRQEGFPTHQAKHSLKSSNIEVILNFLTKFSELRKDWDIPNDGLVLKVNNLDLQKKIGSTSKFPKWAIAYKYPSLIKETILEKITATVGRSGRITYVGKLTPVYIDGSWINWVTLHNYENVKMLKLSENIGVQVYKSGEIIPRVISATTIKNEIFPIINNCPSCNSQLVFKEGNKLQYCINELCDRQKICKIIYFCSKKGVNVEGLSEQIITKLYHSKIINNLVDIFYLENKKEELFKSKDLNIKEKSFHNLMNSIRKSIQAPPEKILCGLGIDYIGPEVTKLFLKKFKSIDNILFSAIEEKLNITGIGPKSAQSIQQWIENLENKKLVFELKNIGFNFEREIYEKNLEKINHFLYGKTAVITGSFSLSRDKIKKELSDKYGLKFKDSISKNIDYLLVGENAGSKKKQAQQNNIQILNLQEVEKLIYDLQKTSN